MNECPRISLCMIVRNEALFLSSCLQSVREAVDEIVVVDTGSVDDSPQIARQFGASVFSYSWNDNFSDARNYSLDKASGQWILILDADELLAEKDMGKLKRLGEGAADGYRFTYRSYSNDSRDIRWVSNDGSYEEGNGWDGWVAGRVVRMFRRDSRFRFIGAVHETVDPSIRRAGGTIDSTDIIIHHFHEKKGKEKLREKQLHYLRLCEENLRLIPNHPKTYFDMGLIHRYVLNDLPRAAELQRQALAVAPDYLDARMELALLHHVQKDSAGAAQQLALLLRRNSEYAPAWFLCGIILQQQGKTDKATECYQRALSLNPHLMDARINLGALRAQRGEFEQAREDWLTAYKANPSNGKVLLNLGALELRQGNHAAALEYFEKALAVSPESAPLWNNLGVLYAENGQVEQAREAFEQALAQDPARVDTQRNLAALQRQDLPV
jgi:tetratricopeptide (TPR) repeat protein